MARAIPADDRAVDGAAQTAIKTETSALEEFGIKPARLAPLPGNPGQVKEMAGSLAKGGLVAVQSASASPHIAGQEPASRWAPQKIQPDPGSGHVNIRSQAALDVLGACGIPPALVADRSDGTSQRESFRRFLHSTVQPLGALTQTELRAKLDSPDLTLSFESLFAADLAGRARAFQSMVKGGMEVGRAASLAGLMEPEAA